MFLSALKISLFSRRKKKKVNILSLILSLVIVQEVTPFSWAPQSVAGTWLARVRPGPQAWKGRPRKQGICLSCPQKPVPGPPDLRWILASGQQSCLRTELPTLAWAQTRAGQRGLLPLPSSFLPAALFSPSPALRCGGAPAREGAEPARACAGEGAPPRPAAASRPASPGELRRRPPQSLSPELSGVQLFFGLW